MSNQSQLRAKPRELEALFAGAATAGEQRAARPALRRLLTRIQVALPDMHKFGLERQD